jgi:hypothetical protein
MAFETRNRRLGPWDTLGPIINAINDLENTNVNCTWFESVASGTSGTITPPTGGTILLDQWSAGVDVLVSGISSGVPDFKSVIDTEGAIITGTLDSAGAWTISGTPGDGYPISLIFLYRVALSDFNYAYCLESAVVEGVNTLSLLGDLGNELSGFPDDYRDQSTIAINALDFTITPVGDKFSVWVLGKEFIYASVETQVLDGTEGIHWIYFDSDGAIQVAVNPNETAEEDLIKRNALIAYVMLDDNDTHIVFADERHGLTMDGSTHLYLHEIHGFTYYQGLTAGDITSDGSGNENASATLSLTDGILFDEDIKYETDDSGQTLSTPAQIPVYYMDGVAGSWRKDTADDYPVKNFPTDTQLLAYNSFDSPNYEQSECGNNDYVLCHIFAVNDIDEPIIAIQGQAVYATIILAREGAVTELMNLNTIGAPAQEFTPLYTLIFQTATAYSNDVQARIRTTDDGDDYIDWRTSQAGGGSGGGGAGDVTGPSSSTDNAIAKFNLATGKVIQNSTVTLSDAGVLAGANLELTSPIINTILTAAGKTGATFTEDGAVQLYNNEIKTFETAAGQFVLYNFDASESVIFYDETVVDAIFEIRNRQHGGKILLSAEDTATGEIKKLLQGDPDGAVALHFNGVNKFETQITGVIIYDGSNAGIKILYKTASFDAVFRNFEPDGTVSLESRNTGDTANVVLLTADPTGPASLYHAGLKTIETYQDTDAHRGGIYLYDDAETAYMELSVDADDGAVFIANRNISGTITIGSQDDEDAWSVMLNGDPDGSVDLHFNGNKVVETWQGTPAADLRSGLLFTGGSNTTIVSMDSNGPSPNFRVTNMSPGGWVSFQGTNGAEAQVNIFNGDPDGEIGFFFNGSKVFLTTVTGADTVGANVWHKQQNSAIETLASSSNAVAWNLTVAQSAKHTLSEHTTISAPSNMVDGGTYVLRIIQAAGLYTLSWNAVFDWGEGTAPDEPAANGDVIVVTFTSDGSAMLGAEFTREEA